MMGMRRSRRRTSAGVSYTDDAYDRNFDDLEDDDGEAAPKDEEAKEAPASSKYAAHDDADYAPYYRMLQVGAPPAAVAAQLSPSASAAPSTPSATARHRSSRSALSCFFSGLSKAEVAASE